VETPLVHLNVKLATGADREAVRKRMAVTPGVEQVIHTFPDETDVELAGLYSLKVRGPQVADVIKRLEGDSAIDFVEAAAPRKLIDPFRKRAK